MKRAETYIADSLFFAEPSHRRSSCNDSLPAGGFAAVNFKRNTPILNSTWSTLRRHQNYDHHGFDIERPHGQVWPYAVYFRFASHYRFTSWNLVYFHFGTISPAWALWFGWSGVYLLRLSFALEWLKGTFRLEYRLPACWQEFAGLFTNSGRRIHEISLNLIENQPWAFHNSFSQRSHWNM
jgi:hypothetical protein